MPMDSDLKQIILQTFDSNKINAVAVQKGMRTLRRDGIQKVFEGKTTIEEVLRVTQQ
jgi:type II secretory ATPase GspE/PulE/Tfp pilus assembly ATPase PilB-like protein